MYGVPWDLVSAMGWIILLPIIIFVAIFEKQIMDGYNGRRSKSLTVFKEEKDVSRIWRKSDSLPFARHEKSRSINAENPFGEKEKEEWQPVN